MLSFVISRMCCITHLVLFYLQDTKTFMLHQCSNMLASTNSIATGLNVVQRRISFAGISDSRSSPLLCNYEKHRRLSCDNVQRRREKERNQNTYQSVLFVKRHSSSLSLTSSTYRVSIGNGYRRILYPQRFAEAESETDISLCQSDTNTYSDVMANNKTRLTLNIRGKKFVTFESTLNIFPETLLGNKSYRDQYYNQNTKEYMFDRCFYSFDAILFYYQSRGILSRPLDIDRDTFLEELEFYKITEYIDARHRQEIEFIEEERKEKVLPSGKVKKFIWQTLEFHHKSVLSQTVFYFYLFISLFGVLVFCAETIPAFQKKPIWYTLETAINIVFSCEYVLRIYSSPNIMSFLRSAGGIVDLIAIIPYFFNLVLRLFADPVIPLSVLALFRVGRVFKLARFHEGLRILIMTIYQSISHLQTLFISIGITSLIFATIIYDLENESESESEENAFSSIPDSFWYTVITATGVGYGDMYPKTILGKIFGAILAIVGVFLFCLPTPMLVNKFVECYYLRETLTKKVDPKRKEVISKIRETFIET